MEGLIRDPADRLAGARLMATRPEPSSSDVVRAFEAP
jgi:hypothetical protein